VITHLLRTLIFFGVVAGVLFGSAGRWDLPYFWAFLGVLAVTALVSLFTADPGMIQERYLALGDLFSTSPRPGSGRKEMLAMFIVTAPCILAVWVVAGLDVGRYHWSDNVPQGVQITGLVALAVSGGLMTWATAVNPFFSVAVRIQSERGHRLISAGPYRYVRHPGYLAALVLFLSNPLALGSWWAVFPAVPIILMLLRRTAVEDRFLCEQLPGYAEYAGQVRYRLLPGLW
jgi:protein-S-isoprenylcysteine O-methyltransferase Ste14